MPGGQEGTYGQQHPYEPLGALGSGAQMSGSQVRRETEYWA